MTTAYPLGTLCLLRWSVYPFLFDSRVVILEQSPGSGRYRVSDPVSGKEGWVYETDLIPTAAGEENVRSEHLEAG
jgi:hypothetical protein